MMFASPHPNPATPNIPPTPVPAKTYYDVVG
jgi:hypothetical protein